jgi:hypothetical protein
VAVRTIALVEKAVIELTSQFPLARQVFIEIVRDSV